jgi:NNP family nitrate/nitrite transporter-like MFS transporter
MLSYPPTDLCRRRDQGPDQPFDLETGLCAFHGDRLRARLLHELGKAAVYKHIPVYYPECRRGRRPGRHDRRPGRLHPADRVRRAERPLTGIWTSCFMLLFAARGAVRWSGCTAIRQMEREAAASTLGSCRNFPEMQPIHEPAKHGRRRRAHLLTDWRPEDPAFWEAKGQRSRGATSGSRSPPAARVSVWMVWSVVVAKLPRSASTTRRTAVLARCAAGFSGATLRIFYSFMVPIFGGRLWTTLTPGRC